MDRFEPNIRRNYARPDFEAMTHEEVKGLLQANHEGIMDRFREDAANAGLDAEMIAAIEAENAARYLVYFNNHFHDHQ